MIITQSAHPVSASAITQNKTSSCGENESSAPSSKTPYVVVTINDQYAKSAALTNVENSNAAAQSLPAVQEAYQSAGTEPPAEVQVTYGL